MRSLPVCSGFILSLLLSCSVQTQIRIQWPNSPCGVYEIQPVGTNARIKVYCETRAADGGIVIQRRSGGLVSFDKGWAKYRFGFGSLKYDHWLGLENIHLLTQDTTKRWTLKVEMWDHEGGYAFAEYHDFKLGDERTAYQLHVGEYRGNAGDALRDQNSSGFSTCDRDNDNCYPCIYGDIAFDQCTEKHGSGWWYSGCGGAPLRIPSAGAQAFTGALGNQCLILQWPPG